MNDTIDTNSTAPVVQDLSDQEMEEAAGGWLMETVAVGMGGAALVGGIVVGNNMGYRANDRYPGGGNGSAGGGGK